MFFNFGASDGEANPVKYSYSMGIGGNGVVPGRPRDTFGLGWARTDFSGNSSRSSASGSRSAWITRTRSRCSTTPR